MNISQENPNQKEILELIEALDAYCANLYPAESNHLLDIPSLMRSNVVFLVARSNSEICGCGAIVLHENYAEVKRMYVLPSQRGLGIGYQLLLALERQAFSAGIMALKLETGIYQSDAIQMYERSGFSRCAAFGDYAEDPLSVFMEKRLSL